MNESWRCVCGLLSLDDRCANCSRPAPAEIEAHGLGEITDADAAYLKGESNSLPQGKPHGT